MARRAGLNDNVKPTPAVALGAYETTSLEIAGAYTMFANGGMYVKLAMDPRVAYLMVNMLEEVLRSGTGAGTRARGFRVPAG